MINVIHIQGNFFWASTLSLFSFKEELARRNPHFLQKWLRSSFFVRHFGHTFI
jgi:hypothetical protein